MGCNQNIQRAFQLYLTMFLHFNLEAGYMGIHSIILFIFLHVTYSKSKIHFINKEPKQPLLFLYWFCLMGTMLVFPAENHVAEMDIIAASRIAQLSFCPRHFSY